MTFNTGQEQSYGLTAQEMKPLWNNVLNSYRQAQKDIEAELAVVYAKYYDLKNPKDIYNLMIQKDRLTSLLFSVTQSWNQAARKANINVVSSSQVAISNAYYRSQYTLDWFTPEVGINLNFAILPDEVINASVFGTEQAWKGIQTDLIEDVFGDPSLYFRQTGSLSKLLLDKKNEALRAIQQTITSGLIQGKSFTVMTSDVKDIIGREVIKDGIKTFTGSKAQAARIVRTEGIRNLNAGTIAQYNQASSQGVDIKKQWLATLDLRTRGSHQSADLQIRELEENFNVNGAVGQAPGQLSKVGENANCRCTTLSVIPGISPDLRVGQNPDGERAVFSFKDFKQWEKDNGLWQTPKGVIKPLQIDKPKAKPKQIAEKVVEGRFKINDAVRGIARRNNVSVQSVLNKANEYSNKFPRRKVNIDTIEGLIN